MNQFSVGPAMLSRAKIKRYSHQRAGFIVSKLLLFFVSLAMMVILLWLRIDWSITNWAHHAYFSNFWTGIYISFAGRKYQYFSSLDTTPIPRVRCLPPQQSTCLLLRVELQQQTACTGNPLLPLITNNHITNITPELRPRLCQPPVVPDRNRLYVD